MAFQLLFRLFQHRLVKDAPLGQPHQLEIIQQLRLGEILDSVQLDTGDGRPLLHPHHQHSLVGKKLHILEKSGGEQGVQRRRGTLVRHRVTHFQRQIAEHRSGFGALDPLHPNVFHHERLARRGGSAKKERPYARQFF